MSPNGDTVIVSKDEAAIREITGAARALFEKYGLKKTTMEDIAQAMGKGKSSLYYYFASKYEIFESVVDAEINEHLNAAYMAVENVASARLKLKAYCNVRFCKIAQHGNLSQVIKNDLMDNIDVIMKIKKKHEANQVNIMRRIISEGVKSGEFKKIDPEEVDVLAFLFTATFTGISLPMCADPHLIDLTRRVDMIVDVMIDGIGRQNELKNNRHSIIRKN